MSAITKRIVICTVGLTMLGAVSASASPRRAVIVAPRVVVHRPFYDPAWGPWYWGPYAYAYPYPYDVYRQARYAIEAGVNIIGPECAIALPTPLENLKAIVFAAREGYSP